MKTPYQIIQKAFHAALSRETKKGNFEIPKMFSYENGEVYFDSTLVWKTCDLEVIATLGNNYRAWRQMNKMLAVWLADMADDEPEVDAVEEEVYEEQMDLVEELEKAPIVTPVEKTEEMTTDVVDQRWDDKYAHIHEPADNHCSPSEYQSGEPWYAQYADMLHDVYDDIDTEGDITEEDYNKLFS